VSRLGEFLAAAQMVERAVRAAGPMLRAHNVRSLEDRIRIIRGLVWGTGPEGPTGSLRDPLMRQIGLLVTRHCPPRNDLCELKSIFDFTVKNVRYTGDVAGKDTFQTALRTLQYGGGDCDDHFTVNAVLAAENGFYSKARITSNTGATWDHIYAVVGLPKHKPRRWIALDTTLGPGRFGAEPPRAKYRDFVIVGEE
jgi:hypothetical protein